MIDTKTGISERQRFQVVKAMPNAPDVLDIGGRKLRLGTSGALATNDISIANAINDRYGHKKGNGQMLVIPTEKPLTRKRSWRVNLSDELRANLAKGI